jgi:hypothetical protein
MDRREQTLAHVRLVASHPGFWEIRALQRTDSTRMEPRGSFFVIASKTADGLIYDRLDQAVDWADLHDRNGAELFIGMNPRVHEGKNKDAVTRVTACYMDLDLPEGETVESAYIQLHDAERPAPSFVVSSGYGLHVVYLLNDPADDKTAWKAIQRGLVRCWAHLGADRAVAPDESRVLRLVPYPNRKRWPDGVPTEILETTENRYTLEELAEAFGTTEGTSFSRHEILAFAPRPFVDDSPHDAPTADAPTVEQMQELADRAEGVRRVLELWIKRTMKPGIHWGIIPIDGKDPSKPTLFKPGAELVALLYGWRFHFAADLDSLQMYGPMPAGTFAYVCHVIDRNGHAVGQGRGVAELREPGMNNANKTVKMALKRAQVDAVLRCAGLSQWFTQDLEEPPFVAPEVDPNRATPAECQDIRAWLKKAGKTEDEILNFYGVRGLEDLSSIIARKVIQRLSELRKEKSNGRP